MFQRILVPLDGSENAEAILPSLGGFLRRADAEVFLMRVEGHIMQAGPDYPCMMEFMLSDAEAYIRKIAKRLEIEGVRTREIVRTGSAAEEILEAAETEKVDLIAMATHGRSGLARLVFGSVSEEVLRRAPVPVYLARSVGPASPKATRLLKKILLPLDGSAVSHAIIPIVRGMAHDFDARVIGLRVLTHASGRAFSQELEDLVREDEAVIKSLDSLVSWVVATGDPAKEILRVGREHDVDLIAMTTHGRTGVRRWALGSVTEHVLRETPVPMLVLRSPKAVTPAESSAPPVSAVQ